MMRRLAQLTLITALLLPAISHAGTLAGLVVKVVDGDTIDVRTAGNAVERVRIYGVNCPERGRAYWKEATDFTKKMTLGKRVKLLTHGRGYYGRLLAFVKTESGRSVGLELVKAGLAKIYTGKFALKDRRTFERYKSAQAGAMLTKRGIWLAAVPAGGAGK